MHLSYKHTINKDLLDGVLMVCVQLSELNTNLFEILKSLWRNKSF